MIKFMFNEKFRKGLEIFLIFFGLLIIYQIIKKIFGGSWTMEEIILTLVVFNIGITFTVGFTLGINVVELKSDLNHLKEQFRSFVNDFKKLSSDFINLSNNFKNLSREFRHYIKRG